VLYSPVTVTFVPRGRGGDKSSCMTKSHGGQCQPRLPSRVPDQFGCSDIGYGPAPSGRRLKAQRRHCRVVSWQPSACRSDGGSCCKCSITPTAKKSPAYQDANTSKPFTFLAQNCIQGNNHKHYRCWNCVNNKNTISLGFLLVGVPGLEPRTTDAPRATITAVPLPQVPRVYAEVGAFSVPEDTCCHE
jgi:hypothetical protein